MGTLLWVAWGIVCIFVVRLTVLRLIGARAKSLGVLLTYPIAVALFGLGTLIMQASGFNMYGYDRLDLAQRLGHLTYIWSPLGMPLLLGAPFLIAYDVVGGLIGIIQPGFKSRPDRLPRRPD